MTQAADSTTKARVAITGATGFLGAALCRRLATDGHAVVAIARGESDRWRLRDVPVTYRNADITDAATLDGVFADCDWVIHAAGRLGAFGISEDEYSQLHVDGTHNVLSAAHKQGVQRILHVSSPGALGPTLAGPKAEDAAFEPSNRYERSKAEGERVAHVAASRGAPVVIARPEFVYGPTDTHVLGLFEAVWSGRIFMINGGRSHCHPTYIDDAVDGMLLVLTQGQIGEAYHIAGEQSLPMRAFLARIAAAVGGNAPALSLPRGLMRPAAAIAERLGERFGFTPPLTRSAVDFFSTSYRFSTEKAQRELGFRPKTNLTNGLRQTVAWYQANGHLPQPARPSMTAQSVTDLYPFALAEGEGVGTAYEYFVKRGALRTFLQGKQVKTILIAGLPEKYGHSSDFFLLAHELGAALTVIDERPEKLAATQALLKELQKAGRFRTLSPTFQQVADYGELPFERLAFDLTVSSEVMQRLDVQTVGRFSAELQRTAIHVAVFCPNGDNKSHVGLSGLNGLTLAELRQHFGGIQQSGLIDMPPFPPGIALSQEQRESAESGTVQQVAMLVLQVYSYFERLLPTSIRRRYAHIVYVFR